MQHMLGLHCSPWWNSCLRILTKSPAIPQQLYEPTSRGLSAIAELLVTPCNVARSWHWFRQVTAPCNMACGSGIMTVNSPSSSTLQCDTWLCQYAIEFAQTSAILEVYFWFRFRPYHRSRHDILHQSAKFYPNRTTLGRKKIKSCRFSRWRISAIVDCRDPIMASLKSPVKLT